MIEEKNEAVHLAEMLDILTERSYWLEAAVIRGMATGGNISEALGLLAVEDFTNSKCKVIFETLIHLHAKSQEINLPTLMKELEGHSNFENDDQILKTIRANTVTGLPELVKGNAIRLKALKNRMRLADMAAGIIHNLMASEKEEPILKMVKEARDTLDNLKADTGLAHQTDMDILSKIEHRIENPDPVVETGIKPYDVILGGGLVKGESYCFAGAHKAGKTMAAGTISYNLERMGVRHAYLALEMGAIQIEQRQIAIHGNINPNFFKSKDFNILQTVADRTAKFRAYIGDRDSRVYIDEANIRTSNVVAEMYRLKMEGYEGLIIDYFSLIQPDVGFKGTNNDHQDMLATAITNTAKSLGLWVLCIAQLNTDGTTYGSKALMRACTHVVALERCSDAYMGGGDRYPQKSGRWLRTISSRFTLAQDIGYEDNAGFQISINGSHLQTLKDDPNGEY